jgi:hypothetical protein
MLTTQLRYDDSGKTPPPYVLSAKEARRPCVAIGRKKLETVA